MSARALVRRLASGLLLGLWVALVAACSSPERLPPVPAVDTSRAQPLGIPNARFSPWEPEPLLLEATAAAKRRLIAQGLMQPDGPLPKELPPVEFLAVSGGGDDGAFGAGLLVGWTEHGDRPEFQLVTGVSTGALIAPYAYLGSAYDAKLREVYTTISPDKIYTERGLLGVYYGDSMADTAPLWRNDFAACRRTDAG